jgi:hypothetical protein
MYYCTFYCTLDLISLGKFQQGREEIFFGYLPPGDLLLYTLREIAWKLALILVQCGNFSSSGCRVR